MKKYILFFLFQIYCANCYSLTVDTGAGGGSVAVGGAVSGGTANTVLLIDAAGKLISSSAVGTTSAWTSAASSDGASETGSLLLQVGDQSGIGGGMGSILFKLNGPTGILSGNVPKFIFQTNSTNLVTIDPAASNLMTLSGSLAITGGTASTFAGDVVLSSMSILDAFNSSFGSVTAGSTSTLTWTEVSDRLNEFVTSTFTVKIAGFYEINVQSSAAQTAGIACLLIKKNNATIAGGNACTTGVTAVADAQTVSQTRILNLAANDTIRIDGSATTANVTFQNMTLTIKRVP